MFPQTRSFPPSPETINGLLAGRDGRAWPEVFRSYAFWRLLLVACVVVLRRHGRPGLDLAPEDLVDPVREAVEALIRDRWLAEERAFAPFDRYATAEQYVYWNAADAARNVLRREVRRGAHFRTNADVAVETAPAAGADPEANEVREFVIRALNDLADEDRRLLRLRFWEGRTFEQMARDIGTNRRAVTKAFNRAARRFQAAFRALCPDYVRDLEAALRPHPVE